MQYQASALYNRVAQARCFPVEGSNTSNRLNIINMKWITEQGKNECKLRGFFSGNARLLDTPEWCMLRTTFEPVRQSKKEAKHQIYYTKIWHTITASIKLYKPILYLEIKY